MARVSIRDYNKESDEQLFAMNHEEDDDAIRAHMETDTTRTKNSYVPSVLKEWTNWCLQTKDTVRRPISLTPENASSYSKTASCVGWKGRVEHALEHMEKDSELDANLLACLLECVITTVISLATLQELPDEYLYFCLLYLQHIKNEFGENPPNIAAFMEFIESKLTEEARETLNKMGIGDLSTVPSNIVITRLPKALQKRLTK